MQAKQPPHAGVPATVTGFMVFFTSFTDYFNVIYSININFYYSNTLILFEFITNLNEEI